MARKPQKEFSNGSETLKEFLIVTNTFFLRVYHNTTKRQVLDVVGVATIPEIVVNNPNTYTQVEVYGFHTRLFTTIYGVVYHRNRAYSSRFRS